MIAAAGPNFFSNGTCIYPRKPVSSQIPVTKELTMTADQPSYTGKLFNILYCDLKAVSVKGMSRKVTTIPDSKTITKSKAANKRKTNYLSQNIFGEYNVDAGVFAVL